MNDGMYEEGGVATAPASGGLDEAIAALMVDVDDETKKKVLKSLLAKMGGTGEAAEEAAETPAEGEAKPEEEEKKEAAESKAALPAAFSYESAISLLNAKGKRITVDRVNVLRAMPSDQLRQSYVDDLSDNVAHETARSAAQQTTAAKQPPAKEPARVFKAGDGSFTRSMRGM